LRALAALQVVLFHASLAAGHPVALGSFGVPLFFVLSGFLMVAITDEDSRPGPFLKDRILRIVPLYWIVTAFAVAVALFGRSFDPMLIAASLAFIPAGGGAHFFPVHNVGWTLNYEMFFYTLFGAVLLLPRRFQLLALTAMFAGLVGAGMAFNPAAAPLDFWSRPIILQFLIGAWLGWFWKRRGSSFAVPVIAIGVMLFLLPIAGPLRGDLRLGALSALLLIGVLELEKAGAFRRRLSIPGLLGDASYSIYLWHPFAALAAEIAGRRLGLSPWLVFALALLGGVAAGLASYRWLEDPMLKAFRRGKYKAGVPIPAGP
jgi:exopolysaccharide production protein ExoZ